MITTLSAKNKLGFMNGTLKKPDLSSNIYATRICYNDHGSLMSSLKRMLPALCLRRWHKKCGLICKKEGSSNRHTDNLDKLLNMKDILSPLLQPHLDHNKFDTQLLILFGWGVGVVQIWGYDNLKYDYRKSELKVMVKSMRLAFNHYIMENIVHKMKTNRS
ncbi:unnamed protein product [Dovyalis caffra]|uniref:Retrotransposon Copia-like N-terminal domain-containing protein n=1 Tax=Dovyalis caffra TaxID=77055 RepID=A0AAV1SII3_9ROSI|nr:unnamed protein product [Dovyalis caffra]